MLGVCLFMLHSKNISQNSVILFAWWGHRKAKLSYKVRLSSKNMKVLCVLCYLLVIYKNVSSTYTTECKSGSIFYLLWNYQFKLHYYLNSELNLMKCSNVHDDRNYTIVIKDCIFAFSIYWQLIQLLRLHLCTCVYAAFQEICSIRFSYLCGDFNFPCAKSGLKF